MISQETIIALASPSGAGAIAVIRLSGTEALTITEQVFQSVSGKSLSKQKTHTIHLGHIVDEGKVLDQVLLSIFKNPHSYTGEDVVEISCHGSTYSTLVRLLGVPCLVKNVRRDADHSSGDQAYARGPRDRKSVV